MQRSILIAVTALLFLCPEVGSTEDILYRQAVKLFAKKHGIATTEPAAWQEQEAMMRDPNHYLGKQLLVKFVGLMKIDDKRVLVSNSAGILLGLETMMFYPKPKHDVPRGRTEYCVVKVFNVVIVPAKDAVQYGFLDGKEHHVPLIQEIDCLL